MHLMPMDPCSVPAVAKALCGMLEALLEPFDAPLRLLYTGADAADSDAGMADSDGGDADSQPPFRYHSC